MMSKKQKVNQEQENNNSLSSKDKKKQERLRKKEEKIQGETSELVLIDEIKNGIVITSDKRYVKIVEITPINFHMRSNREKNLIIDSFSSWIKIAPIKFQFKVLSMPANINTHIHKLYKDMLNEPNDKCRELQEDYLNLLCNVGQREGVTRRFFIVLEHENRSLLGADFNDIVYDFNRCVQNIKNTLKQCGNKLVEHEDEDVFLCELFFSIYNRLENETLSQRIPGIVEEYKNAGINEEPVIKDILRPSGATINKDYLIVNSVYYKYAYIPSQGYNPVVYAGWLANLVNAGEGIDIDIFFEKQEKTKIRNSVGRQIRINKARIKDASDTNSDFDDLSDTINSGYYIKSALANNQDFYYMNTLITISGESLEEVDAKFIFLNDMLNARDMELKLCKYHMMDAFYSALPICQIKKSIYERSKRNILTEGASSVYPFTSFEISDDNGILFGVNQQNNSLCIIDLFNSAKYKNANVSILGTSGAGKTFLLQTMALRMRMRDIQTFIIAPLKGHEFRRACTSIGGEYIKISPGSTNSINILEIRPLDKSSEIILDNDGEYDISKDDSILAKKLESLRAFFSLIVPDMTYEEKQIIDNALVETYSRKGITNDNDSLLDKKRGYQTNGLPYYKKMPILGDLLEILKETDDVSTKRLALILERYVTGSAASFNRQTNVNLDNKYVVVDISEFSEELQPVGMFVALDFIYDKIKEDRTKRKTVFIDETWKLIGAKSNELAANFVLEIFKIIRGYGGSAICATQDINDFFALDGGKFGKGIIANSKTKIILQLEDKEAETVQELFGLSERELLDIIRFERGMGLIITNSNNVQVKFVASLEEEELITTDRERLEAIRNKKLALKSQQ